MVRTERLELPVCSACKAGLLAAIETSALKWLPPYDSNVENLVSETSEFTIPLEGILKLAAQLRFERRMPEGAESKAPWGYQFSYYAF